ncbi:hypothetical protein B0G69_7319 [Paraburkholderia sp. RAU2J]|uniref:hypothetical protein n=1 Tax=Paraburkholderia sp. RAU2J TaxID=1938810 RepID=UPI000EADFDF5|nr:hypothetical protein [Paraburkholderia sp. RAU2J]RKT14093.1 hypothetical protein B0G69_7319 [Paraburkholderia sp. RAU2J]
MEINDSAQVSNRYCAPRCYLAGFAGNRVETSPLYVVDPAGVRTFFCATLRNRAAEQESTWISTSDKHLDLFGSSDAEFESRLTTTRMRTGAAGDFPGDTDRAMVLRLPLCGLCAVRAERTLTASGGHRRQSADDFLREPADLCGEQQIPGFWTSTLRCDVSVTRPTTLANVM